MFGQINIPTEGPAEFCDPSNTFCYVRADISNTRQQAAAEAAKKQAYWYGAAAGGIVASLVVYMVKR